jgi:hypothetical protein
VAKSPPRCSGPLQGRAGGHFFAHRAPRKRVQSLMQSECACQCGEVKVAADAWADCTLGFVARGAGL